MLVVFVAVAAMLTLLIDRPLPVRLLLLVSAAPIAVVANVTRITLTAVLTETAGPAAAQKVYHDFAGWLMMGIGLGLYWIELQVLSRLFGPADDSRTLGRPYVEAPESAGPSRPAAPSARDALASA
jgi:exosortase/archaeosortase family protein